MAIIALPIKIGLPRGPGPWRVARPRPHQGVHFRCDLLRQTYQGLLSSGKTLQQQHLGDIQTRASTLDAGEVMRMVRG